MVLEGTGEATPALYLGCTAVATRDVAGSPETGYMRIQLAAEVLVEYIGQSGENAGWSYGTSRGCSGWFPTDAVALKQPGVARSQVPTVADQIDSASHLGSGNVITMVKVSGQSPGLESGNAIAMSEKVGQEHHASPLTEATFHENDVAASLFHESFRPAKALPNYPPPSTEDSCLEPTGHTAVKDFCSGFLDLNRGDKVRVMCRGSGDVYSGWLFGSCNERTGWFPECVVEGQKPENLCVISFRLPDGSRKDVSFSKGIDIGVKVVRGQMNGSSCLSVSEVAAGSVAKSHGVAPGWALTRAGQTDIQGMAYKQAVDVLRATIKGETVD